MIVKWPGITKEASVCEDYVIVEDVFPTFLAMAGIEKSAFQRDQIDGQSWVPLVKGENGYPADRPLFWHFPHTYDQYPYSSVRKGKWKLIYLHTGRKIELYNLSQDIGEERNVAGENSEVVKDLSLLLTNYLKEVKAGMPLDKQTNKTVEYPSEIAL
jgi:arylsulfatase A-like enzyme